jgi:hypothetical protein
MSVVSDRDTGILQNHAASSEQATDKEFVVAFKARSSRLLQIPVARSSRLLQIPVAFKARSRRLIQIPVALIWGRLLQISVALI